MERKKQLPAQRGIRTRDHVLIEYPLLAATGTHTGSHPCPPSHLIYSPLLWGTTLRIPLVWLCICTLQPLLRLALLPLCRNKSREALA